MAWAELVDIARAQVATREILLSQPLTSTELVYKQEFEKGERAGLLLFIGLLSTTIDSLEYEIANEKRKLEDSVE